MPLNWNFEPINPPKALNWGEPKVDDFEMRLETEKTQKEIDNRVMFLRQQIAHKEKQDPKNWTYEQSVDYFKNNPAQTLQDEAARELFLKEKKTTLEKMQGEIRNPPPATLKDAIKSIITKPFMMSPEEQKAHDQNVYALSKVYDLPTKTIQKNYDTLSRQTFTRDPNYAELLGALSIPPIVAGLATHPAATALGLAGFQTLSEIENAAISKIKGENYQFLKGRNVKDLLPEEANQSTKDMVDLLDFVGKGLILGGIYKTAPVLAKRFTKDIITEYNLPKNLYLSSEKLGGMSEGEFRDFFQRDMGLSIKDLKSVILARRQGKPVDIAIPVEKITSIVDKPYWAKLKESLNIKPINRMLKTETVESISAKPSTPLLESQKGQAIIPQFNIGDMVKLGEEVGKLVQREGDSIIISAAGRLIQGKLSDLSFPTGEGKVVYHATTKENVDKIRQEGITQGMVSDTKADAEEYAQMLRNRGNKDVEVIELKIPVSQLKSRGTVETVTGKRVGERFNIVQPTGEPPKEPPKTAVGGGEEMPEEQFNKLHKNYVRATPIGDLISKTQAIKQELANEDFLIRTYENEITKLERQIELGGYQIEAEKAKAQTKLETLKTKYAEITEAKQQKKAIRDEVAGLIQNIKSAGEKGIAVEYQEAIDKLRDKFDLKKRTEATTAKRESMKAFIERMKVEGRPIGIPKEKLDILDKVELKDMTLEQLRQLAKQVNNLEKLGQVKLRARTEVYKAKKERIKQGLLKEATPIKSKALPKLPIGDKPSAWAKRAIALQNYAQKTGVGLTPIDGIADITGMKQMKMVLDKDFSKYLTHNDETIKQWYNLTKDFTDKEFERIGAVAISRQEGGLERLLNSGITEEEIAAIKLTPQEEKVYKFVIDTFNKEYPAVKQYAKEVYNADVGKVDNYVSFMSDYDLMSDLEIYERFGQTPEQIANRKTKTVEQGFTKERARASNIKLELNIDKIFRRHMDDVAYMLNTGKNIKMYFEIVNSPEMKEKLGDVGALAWLQWLDLMARKGGAEGAKRIAALDILRKNIGAGVLSFRLSSALVQFSSFADTIATIGAEWATKGASSIATSKEWRNFIMDNFPEIKKAVGDDIAFREFGEGFLANLTKKGLKPLQVLDGLMRSTAACGSYQKLAADKGITIDLKNSDPELLIEATKLMRQSQGSSFFKDQPLAITAGYGLTDNRSINKTILTFQSFMLNRWDNINRQIWRLGIKEKNYKKAIFSAFWLLVFAGAVEEGIRRVSRKITQPKRIEKGFTENTLLNVLQSVPLAGQLVSAIVYSSNPVPIINAFEELLTGVGSVATGKRAETKLKGAIKTIGAGGSLIGIPGSSQISQIARDIIPKTESGSTWKLGGGKNSSKKLKW